MRECWLNMSIEHVLWHLAVCRPKSDHKGVW